MTITPTQAILFAVGLGAAAGFRRGWAKEVIACAMVLGTLFFLNLGGASLLASFFAHGLSSSATVADPPGDASRVEVCTVGLQHTVSMMVFGLMTWLGYRTSAKQGMSPKSSNHRIAGLIPGAVNGGAIAYYLSQNVFPGTQLVLNAPGQLEMANYLPEVFAIGLVGLLAVLFITSQASKGGKGGKGE